MEKTGCRIIKDTQILAEMENQQYNYSLNPTDYAEPNWETAQSIVENTPFIEN